MTWRNLILLGAMIAVGLIGTIAGRDDWAWLLPAGAVVLAFYVPLALWAEWRGRLPKHPGPRFFRKRGAA